MSKTTENLQNTLSVELGGKTIVSNPFDYEAACLVDDMRYSTTGPIGRMHLGKKAVNYMFAGTELTDEAIENLPFAKRKRLCEEVSDMFFDSLRDENEGNSKNE